ncbi:MAG: fibronectin type III domain-containing protein [Opitutales bacterium]|nr:fibronectin type III domain-containing protein [Opitutales bacterium]
MFLRKPLPRIPLSSLLVATLLGASSLVSAQTTTTGAALWAEFAANPDNHSHIPNNAYAGYRRGETPVPDVPVVVNVLDFGAVADGTGDNTRAFREAIDAAWYAGGGAVLIPAGTYRVAHMIHLHRDGVVLRGEGTGETIIDFANPLVSTLGNTGMGSQHWNWTGGLIWVGPRDLFRMRDDGRWTQLRDAAPGFNVNAGNWEAWRNQGPITTVTSSHPRGVRSVAVADASELAPGDFVLMTWDNPAGDLLWKEIAQHGSFDSYNFGEWLGATPYFGWPVEIAAVDGNTVSFVRPTRVSIVPEYNVTLRRIGPSVREIGVESMTLRMANTRETYSYNNGVGWNGLFFNRAFNCWARDLEIVNAETPLNVSSSTNVSILGIETSSPFQSKYIFTNRVMSHDVLYDGFDIRNTGLLSNGINTEWLGTGNVWTRGNMDKGTFDSHRLMSFDYLRTDITMVNPAEARPGGAGRAGPFTGRRAVHWNVRIENTERPENTRGEWVFHPVQYTYGAQIGIIGAPPYTLNQNNVWAMPAGDKNMLVGDVGGEPAPANLFDAQIALRHQSEAWAVLAWPNEGFLDKNDPVFRVSANPPPGTAIAAVRFHINGELVGTADTAPYTFDWTDAVPGRHTVRIEILDSTDGSTWSRPYDVVVGERIRLEHNDPFIQYGGGTWNVISHPEFSAGQARLSEGVGNRYLEVVFRGTRARWITRENNNGQDAIISLNGFDVANVNVHGGQVYYRQVGWDSGELPEGIYTLRIRTANRILLDHLEITSTAGATGEPTAPDAPANLTATPVSSSEIDLLWTRGSNNEQGFRVQRRLAGETDWTFIANVGAAFTNFADSGLAHGATYEYRVQAFNTFGESAFSEIATATTPEPVTAPAAPSGLTGVAVSHNRVDLEWTNNATDHLNFQIERLAAFGSWQLVATLPLSATSWIDIGLTPETTYQYRVRATNSAGPSPFSNVVEVTTPALSETAGNLFPESWFVQSLDNTGEVLVNEPDRVAFAGETTGQYRGVVARINEPTTLSEEGDFIEMSFVTGGMPASNNLQYSLRFGLYNDLGTPVAEDFSTATTGSVGLFSALGNRTSDGRRSNLLRQGPGAGQILARGNGANGLPVTGVNSVAETTVANHGNRDALLRIERLGGGVLRMTLDVVDASSRPLFLTVDIPAGNVPTYTFNQIAFLFAQESGTPTIDELVLRRGGPSFDGDSQGWTLDAWRALHFTPEEMADPAISGPLADPTGSGVPNRLRHAFGLDPWENPGGFLPEVVAVGEEGQVYLEMRYQRDLEASGVAIVVEASADLVDWTSFNGSIVPWGDPEPTGRPQVVRETARLTVPLDSSRPLFMRLRLPESSP